MLLQPIVWTLLIGVISLTGAQARVGTGDSNDSWKTFAIPEFGTRLQYPAGIFSVSDGKAAKGTGEQLRTEDGRASLSIYSLPNEKGETPRTYLLRNLRFPRSALEYQRVTGSFFAISAVTGGQIYYSRCNFSAGSGGAIHCFDLIYPEGEKRAWDGIVTRISLSLRPLQIPTTRREQADTSY